MRPNAYKHSRTFEYPEWEDSGSDKEGKAIKNIYVSLINSGIAGLAKDRGLAFLGPSPEKVDHEERKMNVFPFQCLSRLLSVLSWNWLDLPPQAIMRTRPPETYLKLKGTQNKGLKTVSQGGSELVNVADGSINL